MTRKTAFIEGWSWFKFNKLGLALGTNFKFCTSVAKRLKLKVWKFWGLVSTFLEVTGEKLVGWAFLPPPPILNRVKCLIYYHVCFILLFLYLILKNDFYKRSANSIKLALFNWLNLTFLFFTRIYLRVTEDMFSALKQSEH